MQRKSFSFKGYVEYKSKVKEELEHYIESNFLQRDCFLLLVAINEAINNALLHNDKQQVTVQVSVKLSAHNLLYIRIKDNGKGFDGNEKLMEMDNKEKTLLEQRLYEEDGRGILIMKEVCDKVIYNQTGNEVLLVKSADAPVK